MTNKTLKSLLEAMANNSPYTLGSDYSVSIHHDYENYFWIYIFPKGSYPNFFTGTLLQLMLAYAKAFHLSLYCESKHGVPVISLTQR